MVAEAGTLCPSWRLQAGVSPLSLGTPFQTTLKHNLRPVTCALEFGGSPPAHLQAPYSTNIWGHKMGNCLQWSPYATRFPTSQPLCTPSLLTLPLPGSSYLPALNQLHTAQHLLRSEQGRAGTCRGNDP